MAEFNFRLMEASHIKSNVIVQFLIGGLMSHFAGIFHLPCSIQKLYISQIFGGKYDS
jgi:hypothetical protein